MKPAIAIPLLFSALALSGCDASVKAETATAAEAVPTPAPVVMPAPAPLAIVADVTPSQPAPPQLDASPFAVAGERGRSLKLGPDPAAVAALNQKALAPITARPKPPVSIVAQPPNSFAITARPQAAARYQPTPQVQMQPQPQSEPTMQRESAQERLAQIQLNRIQRRSGQGTLGVPFRGIRR